MNTKHTPGPWCGKDGQIYSEQTGKTLALISYFDKDSEKDAANQKLIAAAPELLQWVSHIVTELCNGRPISQFEVSEMEQLVKKVTE